jgi:predicted RNA-binding protein YlxR (DUF448 family)
LKCHHFPTIEEALNVVTLHAREKKGRGGYIKVGMNFLVQLHEYLYQKKLKCHNFPAIYESVVKVALCIREKNGRGGYIKC